MYLRSFISGSDSTCSNPGVEELRRDQRSIPVSASGYEDLWLSNYHLKSYTFCKRNRSARSYWYRIDGEAIRRSFYSSCL